MRLSPKVLEMLAGPALAAAVVAGCSMAGPVKTSPTTSLLAKRSTPSVEELATTGTTYPGVEYANPACGRG